MTDQQTQDQVSDDQQTQHQQDDKAQQTNQDQTGQAQQDNRQQTFGADYVEKLRQEAAGYRTKLRELEEAEKKRKEAEMTELERIKSQLSEREAAFEELRHEHRQAMVTARAQLRVSELGGKPERAAYITRLADLSGAYDENDGIDYEAIDAAINSVLSDVPELKAGTGQNVGGTGSNPPGGGTDPEKNPWSDEHLNLMEQGRIFRADPQKAQRLAKAAGKELQL